ncbi:Methylmalonyl-CoA mutase [Tenacibaculum litopenaei]|uniref:methylmalonyl-CoA mutase subunit beta n=1 Tax=Tenacibaculum litopenaei TaxID=396016 RepID=UPI0038959BDC
MDNYLFDEFEKVSPQAWKNKIQVDLKGADYNETLLWDNNEGIRVKPFYTKEDRASFDIKLPSSNFNICQKIQVDNEVSANQKAKDALQRGADAIEFICVKSIDPVILLKEIDVKHTHFYFRLNTPNEELVNHIRESVKQATIFFNIDPIGTLVKTGNWHRNYKADTALLNKLSTIQNSLLVDASTYQNAGANCSQQLAYALAHTHEYIAQLGPNCVPNLHFRFAVGSNYFFEIAKLRAFRVLLAELMSFLALPNTKAAHIFAEPSTRNKTLYDYNVNMLRSTSESMSAVLGGANTVANIPYDDLFHEANEFGDRISRNQLLILKEECEMETPHTIANGVYYIEALTQQLVQKALEIFKQIEKGGGLLKQLKEGTIQRKINESAQREQADFDRGELVLLGTNKIQNDNDRMKGELQKSPFLKERKEKTLLQPILPKRLAEKLEQKRLENE